MSQGQSGDQPMRGFSPVRIAEQFPHTYNVLIDTDIGDDIDDALALALALQSPEIKLRAVTTVFGDTLRRAQLASHLLHVYGRNDIPIAVGRQEPLQPRHRPSGVPQAAILNGNEEHTILSDCSGPELIVQTALSYPGQLTLLCLGPLTNVALALGIEPRLFMAIRNIIMMGGSSGTPLPEWNVRSDARAAQIVLAAGVPVTMLGMNVTMRCPLRKQDIEALRKTHLPQTELLSQLLAIWQRHRPRWHGKLPYLHDPLTVAALCSPQLFRFEEMTVRVLTRGPFQGFMVPRVMDGPLVQAALDVRVEEAREWVMERILGFV
ncbi:MAG TPA: nucleoside hydrolase [Ktedonobacteraceae bacterium]|nr:nucleoside hydrolase [Ktedonobacteraceae bacterium]